MKKFLIRFAVAAIVIEVLLSIALVLLGVSYTE